MRKLKVVCHGNVSKDLCKKMIGQKVSFDKKLIEYQLSLEEKHADIKLKILNNEYGLINDSIVRINELCLGMTYGLSNWDYITKDLLEQETGKEFDYKSFSKNKVRLLSNEANNGLVKKLLELQ
ncbi:MAG: hypothetical protein WC307_01085 [Candidatus Nanoarchaeia archaeon]|jgi:hypothetical protein